MKGFKEEDNLLPEIFVKVLSKQGRKAVYYYEVKNEVDKNWENYLICRVKNEIELSKGIILSERNHKKRLVIYNDKLVIIYNNLDEKYFKEVLKRLRL